MPQHEKWIEDGVTTVRSPLKVCGPAHDHQSAQLRKRGIDTVILAGMSANRCTQAHLCELLEPG